MIRYLEMNQEVVCKCVTGSFGNSQNSAQGDLGQILRRQTWNTIVIL